MQALTSPGSLVTLAGALLSVIGWIGYATENPNLSLPTIFYGIPILLGGLALKSSELAPAELLPPAPGAEALRNDPANLTLRKLVKDVNRWRYGQKAHLESSLEALKLWDEDQPPQLLSVRELQVNGGYGVALRFETAGVPYERWQAKQERLGRFFAPGLEARLGRPAPGELLLELVPAAPEANANAPTPVAPPHG
ncbi:DUF2854 domain-containing protein [Vulcanococcus limneticus]|uniref:DUF2854 domain-containing protein n=1 Tax=Vulcanococcus limneticus TaxID=2170428 RepID=UPI000B997EE3|nr:DUF2854 domain-containing protein [Vulcanococcus limneticus]MCP9790642.1 DUF2854 domain-containing protein [Vulcanococcus limneticus MW73D5]MCP9892721.1 DUF2854 domain-containing protein [Vulcanococcus limneticus Candia 3F8]MCP9896249.1 DUF2854 domain-containing protein [Vulcanococcus limneticus Candia 3B3]